MKNLLKKLTALTLAVVAVVSFAGCGMQTATVPNENKVKVSEFKGDSGVQKILKELLSKKYISEDNANNCVKTNAELIGAKEGYRVDKVEVNGSSFSLEVYQYDNTDSDTAKNVIDSVKKNGTFDLFGRTVSYCYMSDNGKYLLIYPDPKSTTGKEDDSTNAKRKDDVMKVVNSAK